MANFSESGPDPDKPGSSGTGSTRTGCINNTDSGCNFSNSDISGLGSGVGEPGSPEPGPGLLVIYLLIFITN